jgi:proline racemase
MDVKLKTKTYGEIIVSTVFGGDTFIICNARDFNLTIEPKNAKKFVEIAKEIIKIANQEFSFSHPTISSLDYISFCQFIEPVKVNSSQQKEGWNTVCIRPGKLDRSPCGTGTSARLALMKEKNEIDVNEVFISRSIIGSTFETKIKEEVISNGKKMIKPLIKGSAFITGKQELYVSKNDPFPEGYRLNDTWPDF